MRGRRIWALGTLVAVIVGIATAIDVASQPERGLAERIVGFALSVSPIAIDARDSARAEITLKL